MSNEKPKRGVIQPHGATLPPPRPGVRHVPVPMLGVVIAGDPLRRRVDRFFHWPMIVLALLILPLLLLDHLYLRANVLERDSWMNQPWVFWAVRIGLGVIWLAFLIEFIVKITIAESRVEYAKRNWLDIVIIVIPVLRPVRAAAATSRVFTLRGVGMKCARYVFTVIIGLEASERLLHRIGIRSRSDRPDPADMTRHQLMQEVRHLRGLTDAWESWHEAHQVYLREHHDIDAFDAPAPSASGVDGDESTPSGAEGETRIQPT